MDKTKLTQLFKLNRIPISISGGQSEIFNAISNLDYHRVQIIAPTQYGKSLVIALAVLLRAIIKREKWTILAPSEKKAQIIMSYIIEHIFDQPTFLDQLDIDKTVTLDRLRRERSRNSINFKRGGGIMTLSLDAKNGKRSVEAAMGFGGNRLVLDESSLIDDVLYATVKRMLGGYPSADQYLIEIGNPFYRNHFYRTWNGSRYHKIFIDYHQGIAEGRYSPEYIEEMREEALFDIFYECKFPDEDEIDSQGYRLLLHDQEIKDCIARYQEPDFTGGLLGIDIGGGGDLSTFIIRKGNMAKIESFNKSSDTMTNVTEAERIMEKYKIQPEDIFIDDIGIGHGVCDRLKELGKRINAVSVGEKAMDTTRYSNIKAENYWALKQWIEKDGGLLDDTGWNQLNWLKYKVNTDKVISIQPKVELKKLTGKSPDFAEGLMLTFTKRNTPNVRFI